MTAIQSQNNPELSLVGEQREAALEDSTLRPLLRWFTSVQLGAGLQPINYYLHWTVYEVFVGRIQEQPNLQERTFHKWFYIMMAEEVKVEGSQSLDCLKEEITADVAMLEWHKSCIGAIQGRRTLFVDSEGYLGSGPLSMTESDQVALLVGLPVPAILRRTNSKDGEDPRYYFVGLEFICGMIKGSGIDKNKFTELRII